VRRWKRAQWSAVANSVRCVGEGVARVVRWLTARERFDGVGGLFGGERAEVAGVILHGAEEGGPRGKHRVAVDDQVEDPRARRERDEDAGEGRKVKQLTEREGEAGGGDEGEHAGGEQGVEAVKVEADARHSGASYAKVCMAGREPEQVNVV
jgi:hypothetical protein